jgi:hypothetical protein
LSLEWELNRAAASSPELKNRGRILRQQAQVNTVTSFRRLVVFLARQLQRFVVCYARSRRLSAILVGVRLTPL